MTTKKGKKNMAKHFEDKKYADSKFYQNKLSNIMKKLNIEKYRYQYTDTTAFINFKIGYSWYQINHTLENAKKNSPGISNGTDVFAELVLTMEDLLHISERNISDFKTWVSPFELKAGSVELPECFAKLGFDGRYKPSKKNVDFKFNELAKVLDPQKNPFGDKEKFEELKRVKEECYSYLEEE